jgi:hypothetical protein
MRGHRLARVAVGALALALIGASAACTTSTDGGSAGGAASPGVTDDAVKVGFQIVDTGSIGATQGFAGVNQGTYEVRAKGVQAIVDYVNQNGGLGGRQIQPTIKKYDGTQDSPEYAEAECRSFTQDTQVFAVLMEGQFQNNVRPCYRAASTVMLDQTLVAHDTQEFEQYSPYLWSPTVPEYSSYITSMIDVLKGSGFFNGATGVSVVAPDTEVTRRIATNVVLPKLNSLGLTKSATNYIDSSNIGSLGAGASAALTATQAAGLNRVMVIGGARILPVLFADPAVGDLDAKYTITSFDNPAFFIDNQNIFFPQRLVGMQGLGYMPALDLRKSTTEVFPDPTRPNEALCKQIVDNAGAAPPETFRENYRVVMQFCDSTLALKAAFDKLPKGTPVTGEGFRDALWGAGTGWSAATVPSGGWPANSYAGVSQGAGMYWNTSCVVPGAPGPGCYLYGTTSAPLTAAAAPPAGTVTTPAATPAAPTGTGTTTGTTTVP